MIIISAITWFIVGDMISCYIHVYVYTYIYIYLYVYGQFAEKHAVTFSQYLYM